MPPGAKSMAISRVCRASPPAAHREPTRLARPLPSIPAGKSRPRRKQRHGRLFRAVSNNPSSISPNLGTGAGSSPASRAPAASRSARPILQQPAPTRARNSSVLAGCPGPGQHLGLIPSMRVKNNPYLRARNALASRRPRAARARAAPPGEATVSAPLSTVAHDEGAQLRASATLRPRPLSGRLGHPALTPVRPCRRRPGCGRQGRRGEGRRSKSSPGGPAGPSASRGRRRVQGQHVGGPAVEQVPSCAGPRPRAHHQGRSRPDPGKRDSAIALSYKAPRARKRI